MRQQAIGTLIGATGGTAFVLVNAGAPLSDTLTTVARVLGVALLVAVLAVTFRQREKPATASGGFTKGYWFVVLAEVVALFGGFQVLRALDAPPQANVAWVAVVVGLHFVAFVLVWRTWTIAVPGVILAVLGGIGLAMAWTSAVAWVPVVSGVLSGLTLLLSSLVFSSLA
ncbi:hypothetical protein [Allokutzneria sp. NRRL B-24872]|uniref:hypothetical protein n=1 Tax=Allokutzneria sp. NRRL B-24872 TaxID=1137961 RepID=UPI000A3BB7FF|nr:hypothetical protein [Allokutzneria sp. NRRL B-24872]